MVTSSQNLCRDGACREQEAASMAAERSGHRENPRASAVAETPRASAVPLLSLYPARAAARAVQAEPCRRLVPHARLAPAPFAPCKYGPRVARAVLPGKRALREPSKTNQARRLPAPEA